MVVTPHPVPISKNLSEGLMILQIEVVSHLVPKKMLGENTLGDTL